MTRFVAVVLAIVGIRLWAGPINKIRIPRFIPKNILNFRSHLKFEEVHLISLLTAVRQEIVSGISVNQAVANVLRDQPVEIFANSRSALTESENLFEGFELDAKRLESAELQQLIKILIINKTSGASIANSLDLMIKSALTRQEQSQQIAAELSGVKATITVLALLPILGMFLGLMMGVNVPYWLLTNPLGWLCVVLGLLLESLGLLWVRRLIRGVR